MDLMKDADIQSNINNLLEHVSGGNGWAYVADVPWFPEYCYITNVSKSEIGSQFFTAHKGRLSAQLSHPDEKLVPVGPALPKLEAVRDELASGIKMVKATRLVSA